MKATKHILLTALAVTVFAAQTEAKIWRVNNMGYDADFAQINDANNDPNVLAGDTLHIEGSTAIYNSANITKPLIIIGAGYFLMENAKTTNNGLATNVYGVIFFNGAQNSQIIGISSTTYSSGFEIYTDNITVKRCQLNGFSLGSGLNNITIIQNFFTNSFTTTSSLINIGSITFPTNFRFNNNIVQRPLVVQDNPSYVFLECNNNVFDFAVVPTSGHSLQFYAASFRNNILVNASASVKINGITNFTTTPHAAVSHNIGSSSIVHFGTANNNAVVTNMAANLFVPSSTASADGKYQLQANSPGSGNGFDNADRGAFGGAAVSNRYTLSGLAPVPVIYEVNTTGVATPSSGLNITIKARTVE